LYVVMSGVIGSLHLPGGRYLEFAEHNVWG
jgi:hypothetical protein